MFGIGNLNNLNSLGTYDASTPWYANPAYALNSVMPSFIHDYTQSKYWNSSSGATGFPISNLRASNATQFDGLGRLIWAEANMLARSEMGSNSQWSLNATTRTTGQEDPFGGTTGIKLIVNNSISTTANDDTGSTRISPDIVGLSGATYTFSFYAKAAEVNSVRVREAAVTGARARISLIDGTVTNEWGNTSSLTAGFVVNPINVGNGWWRISVSRTFSSTVIRLSVKPGIDIGDGVSGVCLASAMIHFYNGNNVPNRFIETTGTAYYAPRFDYNPQTLAYRGLLIEAQQTNFMARSSSDVPADWNANQTSYTAATSQWGFPVIRMAVSSSIAPQFGYITLNTLSATSGAVYAVSTFVKKDNQRYIQLTTSANYTSGAWLNYDFDTNTFTENGTGIIAGSGHAQLLQDGWVRLQFSFTANATAGGAGVILSFINALTDGRIAVICSNATAAVFIFGNQVETNWMATSHIPTYGVTVTRSADQATFTSFPWFNQTKGSWYVEAITNMVGVNGRRFLDISDGTALLRVQLARGSTSTSNIGNGVFTPTSTAVSDFSTLKSVITHNGTVRRVVTNNGTVGSDSTAGSLPTSGFTQINIGHTANYTPGNASCAWIRQVIYWADDTASNTQIQAKTV